MMKTYKLYRIMIMNNIPQYSFVKFIMANNIVEAEFMLEPDMMSGTEYVITTTK